MTGDAGTNVLTGGLGNDVLDTAGGIDTADYDQPYGAVTVNIGFTIQHDTGSGHNDTLKNIENLLGSAYGRTLTGSSDVNLISGRFGNDTINAAAGSDLSGYSGAYTYHDVALTYGTIRISDHCGINGADTVTKIEKSEFSNGTFTAAQIVNVGPVAINDNVSCVSRG